MIGNKYIFYIIQHLKLLKWLFSFNNKKGNTFEYYPYKFYIFYFSIYFTFSTNFVNSVGLFKAKSANTFLSSSIPAFFNPFINLE